MKLVAMTGAEAEVEAGGLENGEVSGGLKGGRGVREAEALVR